MTDTYQHWVERVVGGRNAKPLNSGEIVKSSSGEPFQAIEFVPVHKMGFFLAEVGKRGDKYIYHFYPIPKYHPTFRDGMRSETVVDGPLFYDSLSKAFLEIFKREDQIEADWVEEMKAWVVRVSGWANHVWGDELALRAIEKVHELLRGDRS